MTKYRVETIQCAECRILFQVASPFRPAKGHFETETRSCCPGCGISYPTAPLYHPNAFRLSMVDVFVPDGLLLPVDEREESSGLTASPVDTGVKGTA